MTRDAARITPLLARLGSAWMRHPDLRLGQLVGHAALALTGDDDPWYIEDEELVSVIEELYSHGHHSREPHTGTPCAYDADWPHGRCVGFTDGRFLDWDPAVQA